MKSILLYILITPKSSTWELRLPFGDVFLYIMKTIVGPVIRNVTAVATLKMWVLIMQEKMHASDQSSFVQI